MHLPARLWPVCAGACEVYGSDRLHPSTVQGCVVVVRHARRQLRGQSSLRASPVRQSCWQPTEQQSAERAKSACCIAPPPCVSCPPAFLAPVGRLRSRAHAGKRCSAHSCQYNSLPPACLHSGAGREMMRAGAAAARKAGASPAAATRLQARGRPTRWRLAGGTSGVAIFQSVMRDARVDVGVGVGWQDESYP